MTFFPEGLSVGIILSLSGIIAIIIIAVSAKKPEKILLDRLND